MSYNESVTQARENILESILYQLEDIGKGEYDEIYIHDIFHDEIDNLVSSNSRSENLEAIDDTGHENSIDEGMVDRNADISMQIAQIAYCCIEQELWNDDFMQELQTLLNNETIDHKQARKIIKMINTELGKD